MNTGVHVFAENDDDNDDDDDEEAPLVTNAANDSPPRDASFLATTFNLANCAVGAGVLSVPYAVSELGVVLALVVVPLVALVVIFTLKVLIRASDTYGAVSYQELVLKALGPVTAHAVSTTLILYTLGSCIAYTIIVADAFASVAGALGVRGSVAGAFGVERTVIITVTSACVLLPLSLLRRTKHLAPMSAVTVVALAYTVSATVIEFFHGVVRSSAETDELDSGGNGRVNFTETFTSTANVTRRRPLGISFHTSERGTIGSVGFAGRAVDLWRFDTGSVLALPILVFAFQCHIQIISIYAELRDELEPLAVAPSESGERAEAPDASGLGDEERRRFREDAESRNAEARRETMGRAATSATVLCLIGYLAVGLCAYLDHPDIESNMLKSYEASDPYMLLATVGMGLSAIASYPMNHFSARAALDDALAAWFGWLPASPGAAPLGRHASQTLAFLFATTLTSLVVEDLGKVFQLVGSTAGVLVMCWVPAALLLIPPPENGSSGDLSSGRAAAPDDQSDARGSSRRAGRSRRRTRSNHWTDGGGSIGGFEGLVSSGLEGVEDFASGAEDGGLGAPLLPPNERFGGSDAERKLRRARAEDARHGIGLVLLGLVIAVSNVYVLFFTGEEDVTGEDPTLI